QTLAIGRSVAILGATHTRKPKAGAGDEDPLDEVQSSTGMTGSADAVLVLKRPRHQQEGKLFVTGRDLEERELRMRLDKEYQLWRIIKDNPNDPDDGLPDGQKKIRQELRRLGRAVSPGELARRLKMTDGAMQQALSRMARLQLVEKSR